MPEINILAIPNLVQINGEEFIKRLNIMNCLLLHFPHAFNEHLFDCYSNILANIITFGLSEYAYIAYISNLLIYLINSKPYINVTDLLKLEAYISNSSMPLSHVCIIVQTHYALILNSSCESKSAGLLLLLLIWRMVYPLVKQISESDLATDTKERATSEFYFSNMENICSKKIHSHYKRSVGPLSPYDDFSQIKCKQVVNRSGKKKHANSIENDTLSQLYMRVNFQHCIDSIIIALSCDVESKLQLENFFKANDMKLELMKQITILKCQSDIIARRIIAIPKKALI
jgi:hypothetical protein